MKNKLLICLLLLCSISMYAQQKKPTLMILPSDNWCEQRYFMTTFDNQGTKQKVPNYKQAFQEDTEIGQVISKIGGLMIKEGFPLKDAEQEIKSIEARTAEDNMTIENGSSLSESPLDMLKNKAKSDIIIQIWWKVNKTAEGKSISFTLEALDAYTSKRVASATGTSKANDKDIIPILLESAVKSHIKEFTKQLDLHFANLNKNGREIILTVKIWDNWDLTLENEIQDKEIIEHIEDWLKKNTVGGNFNLSNATENKAFFEQVMIPLYDEDKSAMDARNFTKELQKYLKKTPYNFDVKLMTRGLGEAIIVLGEK